MTLRLGRSRGGTLLLQVGVLLAAVWAWWVATDVLPAPQSLAHGFSPDVAFPALVEMAREGTLWEQTSTSLSRLAVGLAVAAVVGVPIGLAVGAVRRAEQATGALFQLLRMTSPL